MHSEPGNRSQKPLKSASSAAGATSTTSPSGPVLNFTNQSTRDAGGVTFSNYQSNGGSTDQASYGVWIKTTAKTQQMIFQTGYGKPWIYIQNDQIGILWDDAGDGWLSVDTNPISDGTWHHIAVVFSNGAIALYKDGILTADTFAVTTSTLAGQPFNLGGNYGMQFTTPDSYLLLPGFVGEMWNAQIWSIALSSAEISGVTMYNLYGNYPAGLQLLSSVDLATNSVTNQINGDIASLVDVSVISDILPVTPTTPPVYTLTATSSLTEDYIHSAVMQASSSSSTTQPLATFLNSSGQSEALLITDTASGSNELCHLMREPLSSTGWNIVGIGAQVASITASNSNNVAILGVDESIWISNAGHWNPLPSLPGGSPSLSACQDGVIYATCDQGGQYVLYQYDATNAAFTEVGTIPYAAPPVGSAGNLWTIDDSGDVLYNTSNPLDLGIDWAPADLSTLDPADSPASVFMAMDGSVWLLCNNATNNTLDVYAQDPSGVGWDLCSTPDGLSGFAPQNTNLFYALGTEGGITTLYSCDGNGNNTVVPQPVGRMLSAISVGSVDGTLWALDSIGSVWQSLNGNWIRMIQPTGLSGATGGNTITEVVTGQHALGYQYAFYVMDGSLYWSYFQDEPGVFGGYWTVPAPVLPTQIVTGISNIGVVNDPVTASNLIVYGVGSSGDLIVVQNDGNNVWTAVDHSVGTSLANVKPIFNTYNSYWVVYAIIDGTFHAGVGQLDKPATKLTAVKNSPPLSTLIPIATNPQGIDWTMVAMATDPQNQVWTIQISSVGDSNFDFGFVQLTDGSSMGSVTAVAAMIASETAGARVYATDQNDSLWIIRQTGYSNGTFQWSEWHPLGNDCMLLGTGCTMPQPNATNTPPVDLFSLDSGYEVNVLSEDATTGLLTDLVMLQPAGTNMDAAYVSRYLTEVTVTDNNSTAQPNFPVAITADVAVGVWVGQALYTVTPDIPITLATDNQGIISFAFFATDLHTPTFSFSSENLTSPPSIYPAQNVHDYLSGSTSAMPDRPQFQSDGQALSTGNKQTQPDWEPNATASLVDPTNPTYVSNTPSAAGSILQVYTFSVTPSGTSGQWSVGDSSGGLLGGSDFWHDLCNFPHDIDHAIKKGVLAVTKVLVDAANQVVSFTMELANGATQLLNLIVHTVEDVVSAVKAVFRFIGCVLKDIIDWIKALFHWQDILNTKLVLEAGLTGIMGKLAGNLDPTSPYYIGTLFNQYWDDTVKGTVISAIGALKSQYSNSQSLNQITAQGAPPFPPNFPAGPDALHASNVSAAQNSNGPQTNYVHHHVNNYANNGGTFPPQAGGDGNSGDSVMHAVYAAITTNLIDNNDFQPFQTAGSLRDLFSDPKNFADVALYDIITAVEDGVILVLDLIEAVVDAFFAIAGNALAGFQKVLTKHIDIPVISWIYKKISGDPLSLMDLMCLGIALPTTILYKFTFGMPHASAPFTSEDVTTFQQFYSVENLPWPSLGGGSTGVSATAGLQISTPPPVGWLILILGFPYAWNDAFGDLLAWLLPNGAKADPLAPFFSWTGIVVGFILQSFGAPYSIFPLPGPQTLAEQMTMSMWALNFIPIIYNTVFTVLDSAHAAAKWNYDWGLIVCSAVGLALEGMGIATGVEQIKDPTKKYNAYYYVPNFIGQLSSIMKPLQYVKGEPGIPAILVLMGTDFWIDSANYLLGGLSDIT
jgi:hypothetical protein